MAIDCAIKFSSAFVPTSNKIYIRRNLICKKNKIFQHFYLKKKFKIRFNKLYMLFER